MNVGVVVTAHADDKDSHFQGELIMAGAAFFYEVKFIVPIERYMVELRGKTIAEFRQAIDIQVKAGEQLIQLENDEWGLFYYVLMRPIVKIHNNREMLRRSGKKVDGAQVVAAEGYTMGLKPESCYILARPKFGCQLMSPVSGQKRKPS